VDGQDGLVARLSLNVTSLLFVATVAGIAAGGGLWVSGQDRAADGVFAATGVAALVPALWSTALNLIRRSATVDVIALLAIAGALALGEHLAAAVIGLMLATGRALEDYAANRAKRELSELLRRAPRSAHRLRDGSLETIPIESVARGDLLVVKDGDVVPVDGVVTGGRALLDESALTGESRLVERQQGDQVRSGTANAGGSFEMRALGTAEESTYAGIVRMVREAQKSKAPLVRLADRYAAVFVPVTLAVAGVAWGISGDPVRALSVLVVATPCPLLLAGPIAIISGVSLAARRGVVIKGGAAIETMARAEALYLDKTGTLTLGRPALRRTLLLDHGGVNEGELLRLAASLDQMSSHVLASALVVSARERQLPLSMPSDVVEEAGAGVAGIVDGRSVRLGDFAWASRDLPVSPEQRRFRHRVMRHEGSVIFVAVDGELAGAFLFEDPIRPDAPRVLRLLKRRGIAETVMLTGDHAVVAESVGGAIGVDRVLADLAPEEKVEAVREARKRRVTLMVGDGINDAPALAAADVGIAMGARGATSASEAADAVLVVDRLDRLLEAVEIAQRSRGIAVQSMLAGMALSLVAMGFATAGMLTPVAGAVLQEGIDAAAILNALRALRRPRARARPALPRDVAETLRSEHRLLEPEVQSFSELADVLDQLSPADLACRLDEAAAVLDRVLAHEHHDEREIYTAIARQMTGEDPLAAMSRTHQEIFHLARAFQRLHEVAREGDADSEDIADLRRTLYMLTALLRLNIAQEEELYFALDPDSTETHAPAPA
jgi:heavy metal translocating P-type ATPase